MHTYFLIKPILGILLIFIGAKSIMSSASNIVNNLGVSSKLITILAFGAGSSLPELSSSIGLIFHNQYDTVLPNILGSSILNILFCIGISSLITTIKPTKIIENKKPSDLLIMFISSTIIILLMHFKKYNKIVSAITIFFYILYCGNLINSEKTTINTEKKNKLLSFVLLFGSIVALVIGTDIFVVGVMKFAMHHNLTQMTTGMLIMATITSLPEIIISIIYSIKKDNEVVLDNIIGSNMFNNMFVLPIAIIISPKNSIIIKPSIVLFSIISMIVLLLPSTLNKYLGRTYGICMIILYFATIKFYL